MTTLSPPSILDNPDPTSPADYDALDALCPTPAAWLEVDYLGAILADLEA